MYCYCYCSFEFIVIVIVAAIVHVIVGVHPSPAAAEHTAGRFYGCQCMPPLILMMDGSPCKRGGAINCHCASLLRGQRPSAEET